MGNRERGVGIWKQIPSPLLTPLPRSSFMKVLLGVTGCIGAYKAAEILRGLQRRSVKNRVVMTRHATEFVRPLTFEALSGQTVIVEMFDRPNYAAIEHIAVAREA